MTEVLGLVTRKADHGVTWYQGRAYRRATWITSWRAGEQPPVARLVTHCVMVYAPDAWLSGGPLYWHSGNHLIAVRERARYEDDLHP